jgi:LCP family protein required for cell wall assembly
MTSNKKEAFDIHKTLPAKPKGAHVKHQPADKLAEKGEKKRSLSFKKIIATFLLFIFIVFLSIGLWDAVELSHASAKMFGNGNLFSLLGGDLSEHDGKTNILVAGYSADDAGHNGATLTDSIMLISLNHSTKTGYILSIPRDLWVNIPDNGYAKINEAYQDGERQNYNEDGYPTGGMGLLENVVSTKLGVPIDYYALVDYAALRDTVDAVGGIDININSTDPRGIYDPSLDYTSLTCCALANYPNGPVHLNGKQALNLARARGDSYGSYGFAQSDFDRTMNQRLMLLALKHKAMGWGVILNPAKAGHLFDGMASNVKTDLATGNVLPLFSLINSSGDLKSVSLRDLNGKNYLVSYGGALIPADGINDYSSIQAAISSL